VAKLGEYSKWPEELVLTVFWRCNTRYEHVSTLLNTRWKNVPLSLDVSLKCLARHTSHAKALVTYVVASNLQKVVAFLRNHDAAV
jgi:hypothetical protein